MFAKYWRKLAKNWKRSAACQKWLWNIKTDSQKTEKDQELDHKKWKDSQNIKMCLQSINASSQWTETDLQSIKLSLQNINDVMY